MTNTGDNSWARLQVLLAEQFWDRRRAIFVIAGVDPDSTWSSDDSVPLRLIALPGMVLPEWGGLIHRQIEDRVIERVAAVETMLYSLRFPLTPYECLQNVLRDRRVPAQRVRMIAAEHSTADLNRVRNPPSRAAQLRMSRMIAVKLFEPAHGVHGLVPPWFEAARRWPALKALLPPDPNPSRTRANARLHKWRREKSLVHQLWLSWRFGEVEFLNKGDFVREAGRRIRASGLDDRQMIKWVTAWEVESRVQYGKYLGPDYVAYTGYGHPALMTGKMPAGRPTTK